jgi:hypothetical protein
MIWHNCQLISPKLILKPPHILLFSEGRPYFPPDNIPLFTVIKEHFCAPSKMVAPSNGCRGIFFYPENCLEGDRSLEGNFLIDLDLPPGEPGLAFFQSLPDSKSMNSSLDNLPCSP